MGAMPDEVDQLCARLENVTKENYAGVEYHCGTLQGKQVVVCCAGMGKANAASTVQVLCTKYGIDKLIFSGIAGNMTSKIGIGDVCVGETVVYHDAELSMIAQSAPFQTEYHGDPALVQAALDACTACGVKAIAGKIATGDTFVGDAETKKAIEEKCHPDCVEMEGAAVSQIAPPYAFPGTGCTAGCRGRRPLQAAPKVLVQNKKRPSVSQMAAFILPVTGFRSYLPRSPSRS